MSGPVRFGNVIVVSPSRRAAGFTLMELVIVVTVLGLLAATAIPRYLDVATDGRQAGCRGALGRVRTAISQFRAHSLTASGGGSVTWPTLAQLRTPGVVLNQAGLPTNPYSTGDDPGAVLAGDTPGTPRTEGTTGGWCYDADSGAFWADTASGAGEAEF